MKNLPSVLTLLGISAVISVTPLSASANGRLKEQAPPLNISLQHNVSGAAAIAALGGQLPTVAAAHGISAERLQELLSQDPQLKVDRTGRLFYEEPARNGYEAASPGDSLTGLPEGAPPADQAFLLHSRPGARKIIYLDFDGHLLSGTAWNASYNAGNDIVCPPWDIDGNPSVFGDTERNRIVQMWQRVAEDYAPFDVDVTTEYPGEAALTRSSSSDDAYGMRVLVSPISSYVGNYGGIAYIGAFNDVGDYYKPALVFPEKLSNGEKYIAEACSHEAGHNVGLNHDGQTGGTSYYQGHGSGETGWSPIMGVGYYKNLSQWSKGEYTGANNSQDDLAIIQTYIAFRADDHGNTSAAATALPAGPTFSADGIIASSGDVDVFGFVTGAGLVSISVLPCELGPNLDVLLELRDTAGNLMGISNPPDLLGASLNLSLSAGTYYLSVRSTGMGDPLITGYTSYGSIGQYRVSGTVVDPSGTVPPVARAAATPTSGNSPLTVQFSSAQSYDPDGTIAGYFWSFGDGATSQEPNPTHVYASVGDYSATLTVSDNQALTGSDTLLIRVLAPNLPPTASISATPASGFAPLSVSLNGTGSSDPDGSIVSYQWNFGDGTTGSGATVSHVYQNVGSYTVRLTVTDDRGATNSTTTVVQVSQNLAKTMRVQAIALSVVVVKRTTTVDARVTITDANGAPISGASVSGQWGGVASGSSTATTDANGVALLKSKSLRKSGTVTFSVSGVTKATFTYDPTRNIVTSASIAAGPKL